MNKNYPQGLLEFFRDKCGQLSMMRLCQFIVLTTVCANWLFLTIKLGQPVSLDGNEMGVVLGVFAAKAYQKKQENGHE